MKRARPESNDRSRSKSSQRKSSQQNKKILDVVALAQDPTIQKYAHGKVNFKGSKNNPKKLRKTLLETTQSILEAAKAASDAEVLLPAEAGDIQMEKGFQTFKLKQSEIRDNVDLNTARNIMNLSLTNFGPYQVNYSRNGRSLK
jgi:hypothetical protein